MEIFPRIGQTLGKDFNLHEYSNERKSDKKANRNKKLLEKSNNNVPNRNETTFKN